MENNISVTVLILYWNSPNFLKELLDSIAVQTLSNIEVIVVDDKSEAEYQEKLKEIASGFSNLNINIIYAPEHQGVALGRNLGIENAKGKYITVIDSDDILSGKYSLEYRFNFLEQHPEYSGIAGYPITIDKESKLNTVPDKKIPFFKRAVKDNENLRTIYCENVAANSQNSASTLFFFAGSSLFKLEDIRNVSFDPSFEMEEDIEWIIRFLMDHKIKVEMVPFHFRRVHDEQYHLSTPSETTNKVIDLAKSVIKSSSS